MDISSLLPLLLRKSGANGDKMNTLLKFANGEKPDVGAVMDMAMAQRKKSPYYGLSPLREIASYEILGKLTSYFLSESAR